MRGGNYISLFCLDKIYFGFSINWIYYLSKNTNLQFALIKNSQWILSFKILMRKKIN
jgi:hypothetical protein